MFTIQSVFRRNPHTRIALIQRFSARSGILSSRIPTTTARLFSSSSEASSPPQNNYPTAYDIARFIGSMDGEAESQRNSKPPGDGPKPDRLKMTRDEMLSLYGIDWNEFFALPKEEREKKEREIFELLKEDGYYTKLSRKKLKVRRGPPEGNVEYLTTMRMNDEGWTEYRRLYLDNSVEMEPIYSFPSLFWKYGAIPLTLLSGLFIFSKELIVPNEELVIWAVSIHVFFWIYVAFGKTFNDAILDMAREDDAQFRSAILKKQAELESKKSGIVAKMDFAKHVADAKQAIKEAAISTREAVIKQEKTEAVKRVVTALTRFHSLEQLRNTMSKELGIKLALQSYQEQFRNTHPNAPAVFEEILQKAEKMEHYNPGVGQEFYNHAANFYERYDQVVSTDIDKLDDLLTPTLKRLFERQIASLKLVDKQLKAISEGFVKGNLPQ